jgi:hypothetical protein
MPPVAVDFKLSAPNDDRYAPCAAVDRFFATKDVMRASDKTELIYPLLKTSLEIL